jgi:hypothetical protein
MRRRPSGAATVLLPPRVPLLVLLRGPRRLAKGMGMQHACVLSSGAYQEQSLKLNFLLQGQGALTKVMGMKYACVLKNGAYQEVPLLVLLRGPRRGLQERQERAVSWARRRRPLGLRGAMRHFGAPMRHFGAPMCHFGAPTRTPWRRRRGPLRGGLSSSLAEQLAEMKRRLLLVQLATVSLAWRRQLQ